MHIVILTYQKTYIYIKARIYYKECVTMPPKPQPRAQKRKDQYLSFLDKLKNTSPSQRDEEYLKKLSDFTKDLFPYLELENKKKISRKDLSSMFNRYVELENEFDSLTPRLLNDNSFQKFRTMMGKDTRMIHNALQKSDVEEYDLTEIFDQSRAQIIDLSGQTTDKAGANMSQRIHIKEPEEGYFTAHEEPFNYIKERGKIVKNISGLDMYDETLKPDDKMRAAVINYLLTPQGKISPLMKDFYENLGANPNADSSFIGAQFASIADYQQAYSEILNESCEHFLDNNDEFDAAKVKSFFEELKTPEKIDQLLDGCQDTFKALNKDSILKNIGVGNMAKIDKRNSAMSMVASLIGADDVIASSSNMRVNIDGVEQKGTFMKNAVGQDSKKKMLDSISVKADLASDFLKADLASLEGNLQLKKDCANLQILDYICGNVDRHTGNFLYKFERVKDENGKETGAVKLVGIQGIDNDASFGSKYSGKDETMLQARPLKGYRVIPKSTAEKILKINQESFRAMLAGYDLSSEEIDKAVARLNDVKEAIIDGKKASADAAKGELLNNKIKVVDDEELENLSFTSSLTVPPIKSQGKLKPGNLFSSITTTFNATVDKSTQHSNLKQDLFIESTRHTKKSLYLENDVRKTYEGLTRNVLFLRGSKDYNDMMKATEDLTKVFDANKEAKLINFPLDDNKYYGVLEEKTFTAIAATLKYINYKEDDIKKKTESGSKVSDNDKLRLEAAKKNLEKLNELKSEYHEINSYIATSIKVSELEKQKSMKSVTVKKQIKNQIEQNRKNLSPKIENFETAQRDLKLDISYNRTNAQRLKANLPLDPPYKNANDILIDAINLDSRECILELTKQLYDSNGKENSIPADLKNAAEKLNANKLMKHLINTNETLAAKLNTDAELYKNLRNKFIEDMRKLPNHEAGIRETIEVIQNGIEADKMLKSVEGMTLEQEIECKNAVNNINTLVKNGIGSESAEKAWVADFLKEDIVVQSGNKTEKVSDFIKEKGKELGDKASMAMSM